MVLQSHQGHLVLAQVEPGRQSMVALHQWLCFGVEQGGAQVAYGGEMALGQVSSSLRAAGCVRLAHCRLTTSAHS